MYKPNGTDNGTGKADHEVLRKVKKLLALTKGRGPQGEVEAAAAMAQKLLLDYNLSMADVEAYSEEKRDAEEPMDRAINEPRYSMRVDKALWRLFNHFPNFGVKILLHTSWGTKKVRLAFLGRKSNVVVAQFLYEYLREEFQRCFVAYRRATGCPEIAQNDFWRGMVWAIQTKIDRERKAMAAAPATSTALARIDTDQQKLDKYMADLFGELKKGRRGHMAFGHAEALEAGYKAGEKVNLSRPLAAESKGRTAIK